METEDKSRGNTGLLSDVSPALDFLSSALDSAGRKGASAIVGIAGAMIDTGQIVVDLFKSKKVDPMDVVDLIGGVSGFVNPISPVVYHGAKTVINFYRSVPYFVGRGYAEWYNNAMSRAGMQPRYRIPTLREYLGRD